MMGNWKTCQLGDLITFQRGHDLPKSKMNGGGYPVVGSNGIIGYHDEYTTEGPSITIGRSGNVGKPFLYKGRSWSHNTSLYIRDYKDIDPIFIYYFLQTLDLGNYAGGSAVPTLNRNHIHTLTVTVPVDKNEQRQIASVLSVLDDKIEKNIEINENLYQMVATLYASIFRERVQQTTTVGQYSKQIYSGGTPSTTKPEFWNGPLHWFSSGETRNRFAITTEKTITQVGVDNSSTKLAHKYDIVMASAGQGFTRGQTTMLLLDTYVNQSVIVIHSDHLHLPYLFWNLSSRYEELRAISDSSSIRGSLTTKMIAGFDVPEVDQQSLVRFSEFAWPIIAEIEKNLHENEHLSAIRDMLLPKLMSGEIDVSDYNL